MLEIATVKKLAQKSHHLDFSELRTLVEQESDERLAEIGPNGLSYQVNFT
jgi:hypothetical protein